jgi:type VI secretion system protein ImpJ
MTTHAVHWGDGLFLRPHHFQALERSLRHEISLVHEWTTSYAYGFQRLGIDEESLSEWRVRIRNCHASLRDGTRVQYHDEDSLARLEPLSLPKSVFDGRDRVLIYLGLPRHQLGQMNVDVHGNHALARWSIDTESVEDDSEPGNPQEIDFRTPRLKLFHEGDNLAGYEVLPVMRLVRGTQAESPPEMDRDFIPPVLCCEASMVLRVDIVESICSFVSSRVESQTRQMLDRKVAFESGHQEDLELIFHLNALNTALGYLAGLPNSRGIHPLWVYQELCRVVGQLAIFRPERRLPNLPLYDHDDLATCFFAVKRWLMDGPVGPEPVKRPFIGAGLQLQAQLEKEWLEPSWSFFVGVESNLPYHDVVRLMGGELNMKVGSDKQVDKIFARGQSGVKPEPEPNAPRALPGRHWTYFKVDRSRQAWADVEKVLRLGIRINEEQVEGRIDGAEQLSVRLSDGRMVRLAFALFAVPREVE